MSRPATSRYQLDAAPGSLAFVQDFVNSIPAGKPRSADLLAGLPDAQAWLDDAIARWRQSRGVAANDIVLHETDLVRLRAIRAELVSRIRTRHLGRRPALRRFRPLRPGRAQPALLRRRSGRPSVRGLLRRAAAPGSNFVGLQPFPRARRAEIGDVAARSDVMPSPAVVLGTVVEDTAALRILASLESLPRVVLLGPVNLQEEP
jgi:hypothetical protein